MDEGCKTYKMLHHLMSNLGLAKDIANGIPLFNNNQGAVDWSAGCSVSKKLRHLNIQEIAVRDARNSGVVNIMHVPGHSNVADLFTKEHKLAKSFVQLAFQLIRPRDQTIKWMDIIATKDPGGCRMESGIQYPSPISAGCV